ncbi:hypothetical protein [Adhaeribacter aquaticus]|uniref:hypothetical protein n=1 Tax=Adhaeribacter aquaticus TaxID=299567 RepID=UPI000408C3DE|nr:hypothetical protein [Adhaeribacter aquaticus]
MYVNSVEKTGVKTEKAKKFLFEEADMVTMPYKESWNEGYSHNNKFLYINLTAPVEPKKASWMASVN